MGSQWQNERHEFVADRYAEMMQVQQRTGLKGATIFGEVSAFNTINEINYLAFARFGYQANLTWDQFVNVDLGPLLGDAESATHYLRLFNCKRTPAALTHAIGESRELSSNKNGDVFRRWIWLQNYLFQQLTMIG